MNEGKTEVLSDIQKEILRVATSGGDERIVLDPKTGKNKYHLNPIDYENLINRGSCTSGSLNSYSFRVAEEFLLKLERKPFETILDDHANRLKQLINFDGQDRFDVFWGVSGSDLMYYPLIFSSLLHPGKTTYHILSSPEELGSGTIKAARGEYFSELSPFGKSLEVGKQITSKIKTKVIGLPARKPTGEINLQHAKIKELFNEYRGHPLICSLVYGSKSGIEDQLDIIEKTPDNDVIWVVDLCQFRNNKKFVNSLFDKDCLVMLTGSKFYQAPPFCGALLVPKEFTKRLKEVDGGLLGEFDQLLSADHLPETLENLRMHLPSFKNPGLRLRWECALSEMEAFDAIPEQESQSIIQEWNGVVTAELSKHEEFEIMPDAEKTNPSIISFRLKQQGKYLDHDQLKRFYHFLIESGEELNGRMSTIFIGQPVAYGDRSFLRVAIGSNNVRQIDEGSTNFDIDKWVIRTIKSKLESFARKS